MSFLPSHLPIQTHIKFKHFIIKHSNISVSNPPHVSPSLASSQTRKIINLALKALENFFFKARQAVGCLAINVSSASMVFLWIFPFFIMQFCSREYLFLFFQKPFFSLQDLV